MFISNMGSKIKNYDEILKQQFSKIKNENFTELDINLKKKILKIFIKFMLE